jgi:hypothetical protein
MGMSWQQQPMAGVGVVDGMDGKNCNVGVFRGGLGELGEGVLVMRMRDSSYLSTATATTGPVPARCLRFINSARHTSRHRWVAIPLVRPREWVSR